MSIREKTQSLHCDWIAGLKFFDLDGERVLYIDDAPFELVGVLSEWLDHPHPKPAFGGELDYSRRHDANGRSAITQEVWSDFVSWMNRTLKAELNRL